MAVLSAFALAPVAAQAAETNATGTLSGGSLSNTAPVVSAFSATLTGVTQVVHTAVGASSVTDATGTDAGYAVTVTATAPTVNGSAAAAGTGATLTLTPATATAAAGNPAVAGPVAKTAQALSTTAATIDEAKIGTGEAKSHAVVIPGNASAGAYSSTLTFTTAPPVA